MMGTINCVYETPCGRCSKWDEKCNKQTPERGQRIKCNPIDDAFTNKMCQSESDHEWKITELSSVGASYMCRKCGAKKIVLWEEN